MNSVTVGRHATQVGGGPAERALCRGVRRLQRARARARGSAALRAALGLTVPSPAARRLCPAAIDRRVTTPGAATTVVGPGVQLVGVEREVALIHWWSGAWWWWGGRFLESRGGA